MRMEGHTDASGRRAYNAVLSDRAEAVKDYLMRNRTCRPTGWRPSERALRSQQSRKTRMLRRSGAWWWSILVLDPEFRLLARASI